jgi:hypothetical protein
MNGPVVIRRTDSQLSDVCDGPETDDALKVRSSAMVGEEPEVEVALG